MNEISVSDRKSTNNIAEFSIKDEKNYIVNVRKCFFITPDMKYAYMRALSIFEYWGGVGCFITLCISRGRDTHAPRRLSSATLFLFTLPF